MRKRQIKIVCLFTHLDVFTIYSVQMYHGTSTVDEVAMETDITKRMGAGWRNWKKVGQKYASKTYGEGLQN